MIYFTEKDLAERYAVSGVSIRRWVTTEGFPKSIKLAPGTARWRVSDVLAWEEAQEQKNKEQAE